MDPFEALSLCSEISIGVLGFSGVVVAFGDRDLANPRLLHPLFSATLIPLALIGAAFVLDAAGWSHEAVWRTCSGVHALAVPTSASIGWRALRRSEPGIPTDAGLVLAGIALVVLLQIANAVSLHQFWPFLLAVWWGIGVALYAFTSLFFGARTG